MNGKAEAVAPVEVYMTCLSGEEWCFKVGEVRQVLPDYYHPPPQEVEPQQQQPQGDIGQVYIIEEWCSGFGEFGHTVTICHTQYQGEEVAAHASQDQASWGRPQKPENIMDFPFPSQKRSGTAAAGRSTRNGRVKTWSGRSMIVKAQKGEARTSYAQKGARASTAQEGGVGASIAQEGGVGASTAQGEAHRSSAQVSSSRGQVPAASASTSSSRGRVRLPDYPTSSIRGGSGAPAAACLAGGSPPAVSS
ncbi:UNVERIFIED_CONTAM: hypothetical protein FKN15_059482 [Acipenser sinensis]